MAQYTALLYAAICNYLLDNRDVNVRTLKRMIELEQITEYQAPRFLFQLQDLIDEVIKTGNYLPPVGDQSDYEANGRPDIELGELQEVAGTRFGLHLKDRWPSFIIAGGAGAGKTVLHRGVADKFHRVWNADPAHEWVSMIILDAVNNCRDLKGPEFVHLSVHQGTRLSLSGPDGVPAGTWINQITRSLGARLGLIASRTTLASELHWSLPLLNPVPGQGPLRYPSLRSLLALTEGLAVQMAAKLDYARTLIQQLRGMVQDSGPLFDAAVGLELNRDILHPRKHLILDISNLPDYLRHFIVDLLILQVLVPRLEKGLKAANPTGVLFLIDEADLLLKSEAAYTEGLSPASLAFRQGREEKVMLGIGVSALENVPHQFLVDARDFFIFNMGNADSIELAQKVLQVDPRCRKMIAGLSPGHCLIRSTQTAWPTCVYGKTDFVAPGDPRQAVAYMQNAFVPAPDLKDIPAIQDALAKRQNQAKAQTVRRDMHTAASRQTLSKPAWDFLALASMAPLEPASGIFQRLEKGSGSMRGRIQDELSQAGLMVFTNLRCGRRDITLFEITPAGWTFLKKEPSAGLGRGKIEHRFMCYVLERAGLRQGFETQREWPVPGGTGISDAAWKTPEGWVAFEVIWSTYENAIHHIVETFRPGSPVVRLVIVAATQKQLDAVRQSLAGQPEYRAHGGRIEFQTLDMYLEDQG